jgi:GNAT superfamily N-acetyltransferase
LAVHRVARWATAEGLVLNRFGIADRAGLSASAAAGNVRPNQTGGAMTLDRGVQIREATITADDDSIVAVNVEYLAWVMPRLVEEYGLEERPVDVGEIREMLAKFRRPGGVALLAEVDGEPVGGVGMRTLSDGVVEIKRMYVRPAWRGAHVGSTLLDCILREATSMGAAKVRLDTVRFMTDAQTLYRSRGFSERPPYAGTEIPHDDQAHWLFFEKPLAPDEGCPIPG